MNSILFVGCFISPVILTIFNQTINALSFYRIRHMNLDCEILYMMSFIHPYLLIMCEGYYLKLFGLITYLIYLKLSLNSYYNEKKILEMSVKETEKKYANSIYKEQEIYRTKYVTEIFKSYFVNLKWIFVGATGMYLLKNNIFDQNAVFM
jgi:hypothetical protein